MRGLLYSEAENVYATHLYVTSLSALELKATPFLTVALFYRESIVTLTVKQQYSYNTREIWASHRGVDENLLRLFSHTSCRPNDE
jgi:hypothetical protein